jgi:hypothetical protein
MSKLRKVPTDTGIATEEPAAAAATMAAAAAAASGTTTAATEGSAAAAGVEQQAAARTGKQGAASTGLANTAAEDRLTTAVEAVSVPEATPAEEALAQAATAPEEADTATRWIPPRACRRNWHIIDPIIFFSFCEFTTA